ncbi:MAG: twin transmembrane helix small protein [Sphingomicrobium sp.]
MTIVLMVLLIAAMAATAYVLVRGVVTMAQGKVGSSEQQQQWMQKRVMFQAIAIVIVVLILLLAGTAKH